jgi:aquaporin Z
MMTGDYVRRASAEFVGTFALIFVGAGSVAFSRAVADTALAHGLVIAVMVSAVGTISGGHFNPAVTFGVWITKRISTMLALIYWATQFVAATLAALLLEWVLPTAVADGAKLGSPALGGAQQLGGAVGTGEGLVIEAVLTFFLVWVVFATAVDPRGTFKQIAGLAIGLTITFDILMGFFLTGAAMNPARAFGPQFIEMLFGPNAWKDWWVWYVGPLAGGAIAALLYELLYLQRGREVPAGEPESGIDEPGIARGA